MARAAPERAQPEAAPAPRARRGWAKAMSDNIAYALLVYTGLQIFVTLKAVQKVAHGSVLPYLALIVLVAAIIPACRSFEKRWETVPNDAPPTPELRRRYRRDQVLLWLLAIGLPFVLTALFGFLVSILF